MSPYIEQSFIVQDKLLRELTSFHIQNGVPRFPNTSIELLSIDQHNKIKHTNHSKSRDANHCKSRGIKHLKGQMQESKISSKQRRLLKIIDEKPKKKNKRKENIDLLW